MAASIRRPKATTRAKCPQYGAPRQRAKDRASVGLGRTRRLGQDLVLTRGGAVRSEAQQAPAGLLGPLLSERSFDVAQDCAL
jgi:hypothetical protein